MMKKNDQTTQVKLKQYYGSGLMLTAVLLLIGHAFATQSLKSQELETLEAIETIETVDTIEIIEPLEAPIPSITIDEGGGTTTSFGEEISIDDDLPPLPKKDTSKRKSKNEEPSKPTTNTIPKDDSEDDLASISNLTGSNDGWDTWEVTENNTESVTENVPKDVPKDVTNMDLDSEKELALETPKQSEQSTMSDPTPIAVGRIKDEKGTDITPILPQPLSPTNGSVDIDLNNDEAIDISIAPELNTEDSLEIATETDEGSEENLLTVTEEDTSGSDNNPKVVKSNKELKPTPTSITEEEESDIVAAPEAPTPPKAAELNAFDDLDPPTVTGNEKRDDGPSLGDLPIGTLPREVPMATIDKDENREVQISNLIRQLEEEAANKEVAKSSLVPNQMQDEINFDNVPIGAAFRLLAEQAGFNFVEPPFQDGETLSLRFQKMNPLDAFMKIAQARGFAVVTENGFTTLKRPDISLPEFYEVKKYRLKFIQPKWIIQSVANLLEIQLTQPGETITSFPEPNADATSYGGSNDGNSGGGGGTTSGGNGGASANGSQNIGLPTAPRWTSSLPYDEPLHSGEGAQGGEVPFIFIDRSTSSLVIKTTKERQKMVAQYIVNVDKPEPQIMIETKVVEISMGELLEYGTDWSDALGKGITVNWAGTKVNLADVFSGGGTGTWSAFLTIPETSITIRAFQEMDKGSVMNMPRTMTRSGVPVSISSTITDATPAYQIATGTGGTGAVSTPSGFNTFTTGLTIDVVPQILENGMIDININPTVANQIGERTIDANTQTGVPKQTIPIISSRSLTTSAVVPSGMTIMLGGIVETKNTDSSGGIPVLSRIPILGKTIFGNTNRNDSRKTLIVFVTPRVIYPDEYQKVWTNEEEWRAMVDGNRVDIQTYNDQLPQPLEIRKAIPLKDTLNQRGTQRGTRK